MTTMVSEHPMSELAVRCDDITLCPPDVSDRPEFETLLHGGIHRPGYMPFFTPWTRDTPQRLAIGIAYTATRVAADFRRDEFILQLTVRSAGQLVGMQQTHVIGDPGDSVGAVGAWLGSRFQGRGVGTRSRAMMCTLLFDHFGVRELRTDIFVDNTASLVCADKVGFTCTGEWVTQRDGEPVTVIRFRLTADSLNRSHTPGLEFHGLDQARRFLGLP